jgi:hypothetical protein
MKVADDLDPTSDYRRRGRRLTSRRGNDNIRFGEEICVARPIRVTGSTVNVQLQTTAFAAPSVNQWTDEDEEKRAAADFGLINRTFSQSQFP